MRSSSIQLLRADVDGHCYVAVIRSVQELTDNTVETEVLETLKEVVRHATHGHRIDGTSRLIFCAACSQSGSVEDVLHVSQVRARRMGPYTLVDLRVHVRPRDQRNVFVCYEEPDFDSGSFVSSMRGRASRWLSR